MIFNQKESNRLRRELENLPPERAINPASVLWSVGRIMEAEDAVAVAHEQLGIAVEEERKRWKLSDPKLLRSETMSEHTPRPITIKKVTRRLRDKILSSQCVFCDQPFLPCELRDNTICPSTDGEAFAHVHCVEAQVSIGNATLGYNR